MKQMQGLALSCSLLLGFACSAGGDPSFTVLTEIGEGIAWNVNRDGTVVVGWREEGSTSNVSAFRWELGEGWTTIVPAFAAAWSVSDDGTKVGGYGRDGFNREYGWRWSEATGVEELPSPIVTSPVSSAITGISGDGMVTVGNRQFANGSPVRQAARWMGSVVDLLGSLAPGQNSFAQGTNIDGSVIVGNGRFTGQQSRAFRWTALGGMANLGVLPSQTGDDFVNSFAEAVSDDGSVVVGISGNRAFRWTEATGMVDIGTLPNATITDAYDISGDGSVVVGRSIGNPDRPGPQSFIWREGEGMKNLADVLELELGLDLGGWFLTAYAISADGTTVVGVAYDGFTQSYPFIAVLEARCLASYDQSGDGVVDVEDVYRMYEMTPDVTGDGLADDDDVAAVRGCVRSDELADVLGSR